MRTKAIVHLDRFLRNIEAVKARIGGNRRICLPVKANAYGHGALEIAKTGQKAGVFCLGVGTVPEGTELRKGGIQAPVLLFTQSHPAEIPEIVKADLIPFISDKWYANALNDQVTENKKLSVHIKIDTGMGRVGCQVEEALDLARFIVSCPKLELAGTTTHFAVSDSADEIDREYTKLQFSRFNEAVEAIKNAGIDPGLLHTANSGAVVLHKETWLDMVRPGILIYGYKNIYENSESVGNHELPEIKPVMELQTAVVLIKKIKKGESVSYGRTWIAPNDTLIAILPVGYADGFPRLASNKWQVVINGKSYPLAGRICMDQCCIDLGPDSDVKRWDEAVIFGGNAPDAAVLAAKVGTIPYEITCNINSRVPRIYKY